MTTSPCVPGNPIVLLSNSEGVSGILCPVFPQSPIAYRPIAYRLSPIGLSAYRPIAYRMTASGLGSSSGSRAQPVVAGCAAGSAGEGARAERMAASEGLQEGTQAVVANPGGVATDAGDGPQERTALRMEMDRLENETQHTLRGMTDAFSVELPFTVEDKRRIVENLNKIEEAVQGTLDWLLRHPLAEQHRASRAEALHLLASVEPRVDAAHLAVELGDL